MPANSLDLLESDNTTWSWKPTTDGATGSAKVRAPRVNPYAAPQTVDRPVDETVLPVAVLAESDGTRQLFPEQSTVTLAAMVRRNSAIEDAQAVWLFVAGMLGLLSAYIFLTIAQRSVDTTFFCGVLPGLAVFLSLIRWHAGKARHQSDRYLAIGMDWLLFAVSLGLGVCLLIYYAQNFDRSSGPKKWGGDLIINFVGFLVMLPFLIYPGYYSFRSLRALLGGQLLFGPERLHAESLKTELDYRRLHGIE